MNKRQLLAVLADLPDDTEITFYKKVHGDSADTEHEYVPVWTDKINYANNTLVLEEDYC